MKNIVFIVSVLSLAATPAYAQQAPAPQEFNLKITSDDVNTIGKALGKLPFDDVAPLIQKLRQQIVEQSQAQAKPAEVPVAPSVPAK